MLDRLKEASAQELERALERWVKREFEAALQGGAREVPIIGGELAPPEEPAERAEQMRWVVRAILARKWAESELPPWMLPLPLSADACYDLFNGVNQGNRRCRLRGEYGLYLRGMGWEIEHADPFEVFCAHKL
jgi:hypothetical protein